LSAVYLEGALKRAVDGPIPVSVPAVHPPLYATAAPISVIPTDGPAVRSVLDPFSVYEKGEALLRRQLAALSAWHLVNIILDYELNALPTEELNAMPAAALIEIIVDGVKNTLATR